MQLLANARTYLFSWKQAESRKKQDILDYWPEEREILIDFLKHCKTLNYPIAAPRPTPFIFQSYAQVQLFTKPMAHACFQKLRKHSDTSGRASGGDTPLPSPPVRDAALAHPALKEKIYTEMQPPFTPLVCCVLKCRPAASTIQRQGTAGFAANREQSDAPRWYFRGHWVSRDPRVSSQQKYPNQPRNTICANRKPHPLSPETSLFIT